MRLVSPTLLKRHLKELNRAHPNLLRQRNMQIKSLEQRIEMLESQLVKQG